jgi:hypothetical protein
VTSVTPKNNAARHSCAAIKYSPAYVDGVGADPASAPGANLTGDPYYADGLRAVIFLSNQAAPLENIDKLPWQVSPPAQER